MSQQYKPRTAASQLVRDQARTQIIEAIDAAKVGDWKRAEQALSHAQSLLEDAKGIDAAATIRRLQ